MHLTLSAPLYQLFCCSQYLLYFNVLFSCCIVVLEPASHKHQLQSDSSTVAGKGRSSLNEDSGTEELKVLTVTSSGFDRTEARVSSSAHDSR